MNGLFRCLLLGLWVGSGVYGAVAGKVTVDRTKPLSGVIVQVDVPGRTYVTRTRADGTFLVDGVDVPKALLSVLQDGKLVYRDFVNPASGSPVAIDLKGAPRDLPSSFDPIALAVLADNTVVVASTDERLYRFRDRAYLDSVRVEYGISDLATYDNLIYTCAAFDTFYRMTEYHASGVPTRRAWTRVSHVGAGATNVCGVATDRASGTVYFAAGRDLEIYRLRPGSSKIEMFKIMTGTTFAPVDLIGAMAVDSRGQRLFVSAPRSDRIYSVSLDRKSVREFAHGIGEIRALAVDPTQNRLYAADAGRGRIWQFDLSQDTPSAQDFSGKNNIKAASALGIDSVGTLWVGEHRRFNQLLSFSPDGVLLSSISSNH